MSVLVWKMSFGHRDEVPEEHARPSRSARWLSLGGRRCRGRRRGLDGDRDVRSLLTRKLLFWKLHAAWVKPWRVVQAYCQAKELRRRQVAEVAWVDTAGDDVRTGASTGAVQPL